MGDFKEFLQQDEGLGKFLINLGRRTGVLSPDNSNEPWSKPGAIPQEFQKGWQLILNSGKTGMVAWQEFQRLMSTPAGKAWLMRANASMPGEPPPMPTDHVGVQTYNQQKGSDFFKGSYGPGGPIQ